jgi:predicted nucleotidyltransferase component of viral defense system
MAGTKSPQSQSFSGNSISNSQIGIVQVQDGNVEQVQKQIQASEVSEPALTVVDIVTLLGKIEELLREPSLSLEKAEKARKYLDVVKAEVQEEEPDKDQAAKNLKKVVDVLKTANEAAESGKGLWEKAIPILGQLAGWFGIAKAVWGLM